MTAGDKYGFDRMTFSNAELMQKGQYREFEDGTPINPEVRKVLCMEAQTALAKSGNADMLRYPIYDFKQAMLHKAIYAEDHQLNQLQDILVTHDKEAALMVKAIDSTVNRTHTTTDGPVINLYKMSYPVQAAIPIEAQSGKTASYDLMTAAGTAEFTGEDPTLTPSNSTDANNTKSVTWCYATGRVTKVATRSLGSQVPSRNVMQEEIDTKMDALKHTWEHRLIGVTTAITNTTHADADAGTYEFKGIQEIIDDAADNYVNSAGATWTDIDSDMNASYNEMISAGLLCNVAFTDYYTFGIIRRALTDYFRTDPVTELMWGVKKIGLNYPGSDVALIPVQHMDQTPGSNRIHMLDSTYMAQRMMWSSEYEEYAKTNPSQKFSISNGGVLIDKSDSSGSASLQGGVYSI